MQMGMKGTAEGWALAQFGSADLGDQRRTRRATKLGAKMVRRPGDSIPEQAGGWADTKASYRLLDHDDVTFEALTQPHRAATLQEADARPTVLMIQDTTELDFTAHRATVGLGTIGDGRGVGFMLHNTMAVDPAGKGEVLGLADQQLFCREGLRPEETRTQRKNRQRESQIWLKSVEAVGRSASGGRRVHVCDRGADFFELFDEKNARE